ERNRMLGIVAEQNLHIWQLESQLLKTQEGFKDFVGEPFLTSTSYVEEVDGEVAITRSPYLSGGSATAFLTLGMVDDPIVLDAAEVFPGVGNVVDADFATDPTTGTEYCVCTTNS